MESSVLNQIVELLEVSRREVADSVSALSDADAARKPAPGRWSPLECMEHIVIVEGVYLGWLERATVLDSSEPQRRSRVLDHCPDDDPGLGLASPKCGNANWQIHLSG